MKIAHVLSHVSNVFAGVPIATCKMGLAQKAMGIDISFWTTGDENDRRELANSGIPAHVFTRSWPFGWRYAAEFANGLRQSVANIDLLHIHEVWQYPQLAAYRIAKCKKIPYIWAPRASLDPWRMKHKGWKKQAYFKMLGNRMMKYATCMHAVSDGEAEGLRQLSFRGPIAVVPNGISHEEFSQLPEAHIAEGIWPDLINRKVVLFLSRLSPEKGLDQLLPAWADIVRKNHSDDLLLVLAGPDDRGYRKVLDEIVFSHSLQKHIFFTGMVSGNTKLALISRANIYVLPSYSEGFSNSLLENLAAGNPALITPGCNFPEAVHAGAAICIEPLRDEISEGLTTLINMPDRDLLEMNRKGRELVLGSYTWEVAARRLVTVYRSILNNSEIPLHPDPADIRQ
jgi:glycosyltransferase involved in cell wall biosynthesis